MRRVLYHYIQDNDAVKEKFGKSYLKVFVITNKDSNAFLQKLVETNDKKHIKEEVMKMIDISFKNFCQKYEATSKKTKDISG